MCLVFDAIHLIRVTADIETNESGRKNCSPHQNIHITIHNNVQYQTEIAIESFNLKCCSNKYNWERTEITIHRFEYGQLKLRRDKTLLQAILIKLIMDGNDGDSNNNKHNMYFVGIEMEWNQRNRYYIFIYFNLMEVCVCVRERVCLLPKSITAGVYLCTHIDVFR